LRRIETEAGKATLSVSNSLKKDEPELYEQYKNKIKIIFNEEDFRKEQKSTALMYEKKTPFLRVT